MHGVHNPARRVALAAVLATSLLACWSDGAFGNPFHEVPKQYRGIWCDGRQDDEVTEFYRRCRRGGDYSMEIQARQFADSRYYECLPIALIRTDHGDLIVQAVCRVEAATDPELLDQRWRVLDGGRRLKVIGGEGVPLSGPLREALDPRSQ